MSRVPQLPRRGRPSFAAVAPRLLVGEYATPTDASWLRRTHGVGAVVCLQDDIDLANRGLDPAQLRAAYARAGIEFHHLPIVDGDDDQLCAALGGAVALLRRLVDARTRVYLHCSAGMNRAPTVAIAFLHEVGGLPLDRAHELMRSARPCVPYMRALRTHYRA